MKDEHFGPKAQAHFDEFYGDPLEQHEGAEYSREDVMEEINELLERCYSFGINPLKYLRTRLPQYEWGYTYIGGDPASIDEVRPTVQKADFMWWLDHAGMVWARMPDRPEPRTHYVYRISYCFFGTMKFIMESGATIVSKDEKVIEWANSQLTDNPIHK